MLPPPHLRLVHWRDHRERLRESIDKIARIASDHKLYETMDKACSDERALLFLTLDGFVVLWPRYDSQRNTYIEVTAAYCTGGRALFRYQQQIINIASDSKINAKYVQFLTCRRGFRRVAPTHGWHSVGTHNQFTVWRYQLTTGGSHGRIIK